MGRIHIFPDFSHIVKLFFNQPLLIFQLIQFSSTYKCTEWEMGRELGGVVLVIPIDILMLDVTLL